MTDNEKAVRESPFQDRPLVRLVDASGNVIAEKLALASKWGWWADVSPGTAAVAMDVGTEAAQIASSPAPTGDVRAWMEKLDKLIDDKNLTAPRVFYTWRETRELIEEALADREALRVEVAELKDEMAGMIPIEQA